MPWPAHLVAPQNVARAVLEHGRGELKLDRVLAVVQPGNAASIRLLGKLGFEYEGLIADPRDGAQLRLYTAASRTSGSDRSSS